MEAGQGYCAPCQAAYMREWRETHQPSEAEKAKGRARSYLNVYVRRGKITRLPCEVCGREPAEGHHHAGYEHPLTVTWLCRMHHRKRHQAA